MMFPSSRLKKNRRGSAEPPLEYATSRGGFPCKRKARQIPGSAAKEKDDEKRSNEGDSLVERWARPRIRGAEIMLTYIFSVEQVIKNLVVINKIKQILAHQPTSLQPDIQARNSLSIPCSGDSRVNCLRTSRSRHIKRGRGTLSPWSSRCRLSAA